MAGSEPQSTAKARPATVAILTLCRSLRFSRLDTSRPRARLVTFGRWLGSFSRRRRRRSQGDAAAEPAQHGSPGCAPPPKASEVPAHLAAPVSVRTCDQGNRIWSLRLLKAGVTSWRSDA